MTIGERAAKCVRDRARQTGTVKGEMERLGVSVDCLFRWEKGNTAPFAYALQQMALSDYDVYYILTGERKNYEA